MADTAISALPDGGVILTSDQVPTVRAGSNFRTVVGALAPLNNVPTERIEDGAVTFAKMQNVIIGQSFTGRPGAGAGPISEMTAVQARGILNVENNAAADQIAFEVPFTPTGTLLSNNVQGAIEQLEADKAFRIRTIRAATGSLVPHLLSDDGNIVTMSNVGGNTFRIESNAIVPSLIGTEMDIYQIGFGTTTILAGTGVTLNGVVGGSGDILLRFGRVALLKIATNTWLLSGQHGVVT